MPDNDVQFAVVREDPMLEAELVRLTQASNVLLIASLRITELCHTEWQVFQSQIAGLEKGTSYPLGEDRFEIDHGEDYFAFFTRLGQLHYYVVLDGDRVVAVVAAILRRVP